MTDKDDISGKVDAFRSAAIAHYDATLRGDSEATLTTDSDLQAAKGQLFADAPDHLREIVQLLDDPHPGVQLSTAIGLLPLNVSKAKWTLRKLAWFRFDEIGLIAGWGLRKWKKERRG